MREKPQTHACNAGNPFLHLGFKSRKVGIDKLLVRVNQANRGCNTSSSNSQNSPNRFPQTVTNARELPMNNRRSVPEPFHFRSTLREFFERKKKMNKGKLQHLRTKIVTRYRYSLRKMFVFSSVSLATRIILTNAIGKWSLKHTIERYIEYDSQLCILIRASHIVNVNIPQPKIYAHERLNKFDNASECCRQKSNGGEFLCWMWSRLYRNQSIAVKLRRSLMRKIANCTSSNNKVLIRNVFFWHIWATTSKIAISFWFGCK